MSNSDLFLRRLELFSPSRGTKQNNTIRECDKNFEFHAHCFIFLLAIRKYCFVEEILHCTQTSEFLYVFDEKIFIVARKRVKKGSRLSNEFDTATVKIYRQKSHSLIVLFCSASGRRKARLAHFSAVCTLINAQ